MEYMVLFACNNGSEQRKRRKKRREMFQGLNVCSLKGRGNLFLLHARQKNIGGGKVIISSRIMYFPFIAIRVFQLIFLIYVIDQLKEKGGILAERRCFVQTKKYKRGIFHV